MIWHGYGAADFAPYGLWTCTIWRKIRITASKDTVRRLRELIRERYRLDIYIWSKRKVKRANRKIIEVKCEKSDAILQEIYFIVEAWEEDLFEPEDWKVARKIKESILQKDQHAIWGDIPPWDCGEDGEPTRHQS